MQLLNCWEIIKCERQKGGKKVNELGECITSKEKMGHSCWVVAGSLCGGKIQCITAQKIRFCTSCKVYDKFNRSKGRHGKKIKQNFPEEEEKYYEIMMKLCKDKKLPVINTKSEKKSHKTHQVAI